MIRIHPPKMRCLIYSTFLVGYLSSIAGQEATTESIVAKDKKDENIIGIKYVDSLNSPAGSGYSDQSDNDEKYECYRCNRYTGGGAPCPETRAQITGEGINPDAPYANFIVRRCAVCLKVKTVTKVRNRDYIGDKLWASNAGKHFESMYVISRTCIEDKSDARKTDGCIVDTSAGGTVERCYCQGNLCNTAVTTTSISILLVTLACLFTRIVN